MIKENIKLRIQSLKYLVNNPYADQRRVREAIEQLKYEDSSKWSKEEWEIYQSLVH